MDALRWGQVKEILGNALRLRREDRSRYLEQVCSHDADLRQEVESLLAAEEAATSRFLQTVEFHHDPPFSPGAQIGDYEVVSFLGAGAMGRVYRARDKRLHRDVALKILPEDCCTDPDQLRRFEREARTAAALNHPNILTVFYT
ncbi:MAG: hypothetical protein JO061_03735, partial [Acidobacteriaceae bacterium]|nr:hypothetical protein [Acidobacteriaceae bacterium]